MIYKVPSAYSLYILALTRGMYFIYMSQGRWGLSSVQRVHKQPHDPSDGWNSQPVGINNEKRLIYTSSDLKSIKNVSGEATRNQKYESMVFHSKENKPI